ncbi:MAG: hypothetical protein WD708_08525 [Kiritimatiellia bacterium]
MPYLFMDFDGKTAEQAAKAVDALIREDEACIPPKPSLFARGMARLTSLKAPSANPELQEPTEPSE